MFVSRFVPLACAAAVAAGGTASAQSRPQPRMGFPTAAPRQQSQLTVKPFATPHVHKPGFVPHKPGFVHKPGFGNPVFGSPVIFPPVFGTPVFHQPFPVFKPFPVSRPPFWGGLWGGSPTLPTNPFFGHPVPIGGIWFGW